jgi:catechol 2,3-dioxygenase-like lactoylglutathione lyase family enzyme
MRLIESIGCATFETPDLARLSEYYRQILGLVVQDATPDRVYLTCPLDHRSVVLARGAEPRCVTLGLEASSEDDLRTLAERLRAHGVALAEASDPAPDVGRHLSFQGPGSFRVEVSAARVASGVEPSPETIGPRKLGHIAFKVADVQKATDFFTGILGFRVSDWMGDFFSFLRCGPDHHTVNFLRNPSQRMHHIAFELADLGAIQRACDFLGRRRIALIWGPGRHGPGHNVFTYHYDPDGQIVELFTEIDRMSDESQGFFDPRPWHEDSPQRPKVWEPGLFTSNIWGVPSPPSFRD